MSFSLVCITLRFTEKAILPFLHHRVVYALVRSGLGLDDSAKFPENLFPTAPESGRTLYEKDSLYALGVVFTGDAHERCSRLIRGLKQWGGDTGLTGRFRLGGNFRVERVLDCISGRHMDEDTAPAHFSPASLEQALQKLSDASSISIRFVSPLRLPRHTHTQVKGHRFVDEDLFEADRFMSNLITRCRRILPGLVHPNAASHEETPRVSGGVDYLQWLDLPKQEKKETLGGVVGQVEITSAEGFAGFAPYLALGQYIGAGKDTNLGFGRYRILAEIGLPEPPVRAETLTRAAADLPREARVEHVLEPVFDLDEEGEEEWEPFDPQEEYLSDRELEKFASGKRKPGLMQGRIIVNESGKARALAIPPPEDQALQRRVHSLLAPAVEELLETSSYGFRRGISRQGAATALRKAYDAKLRWVVRADIDDFFDSVDWNLLQLKLEALWDNDPVVGRIMDWVKGAVRFSESIIERDRGLPQGAVLSPMLANLFLDRFDEDVERAGFKLVRYADDFVICCRSREEAESAREAARELLAELDLSLNEDKTAVTHFDHGFTYLGYTFCRSLIAERSGDKGSTQWIRSTDDADSHFWARAVDRAPVGNWLSRLDPDQGERLTSTVAYRRQDPFSRTGRAVSRMPVYIDGPRVKLYTSMGRLVVKHDADGSEEIPLALIESLICYGFVHLSYPVIRACMYHRVPITLCSATGTHLGTVCLPGDDQAASVIRAQTDYCRDETRKIAAAREMIAAKIDNCRVVLQRQRKRSYEDENALREMMAIRRDVEECSAADTLRSFEARAAWVYWNRLSTHIPREYGFHARFRPAMDPVNSLLNFGYTLLYRQIESLVRVERIHPGLGVFHTPTDYYHALVCDLQEEFRFLTDLMVLRLIHLKQVRKEDFTWVEKPEPQCRIRPDARRVLVSAWQSRLMAQRSPGRETEPRSFREIMHQQVKGIKKLFLNPDTEQYRAFRDR